MRPRARSWPGIGTRSTRAPSLKEGHVAGVTVFDRLNNVGCVKVVVYIFEQALASVINTVYVPAIKVLMSSEVDVKPDGPVQEKA